MSQNLNAFFSKRYFLPRWQLSQNSDEIFSDWLILSIFTLKKKEVNFSVTLEFPAFREAFVNFKVFLHIVYQISGKSFGWKAVNTLIVIFF